MVFFLERKNSYNDKHKERLGLIHIYTGEGKGKTTASMGLALRALGNNFKVLIVQFFKFGTGEKNVFSKLNHVDFLQFNVNSEIFMHYTESLREKNKKKFLEFLKKVEEKINNNYYDFIIFDEIVYAFHMNFISEEDLKNFILKKPKNTELILTGRDYPKSILEIADYITEMKKIKHPFDNKITARKGVEY